MKNFYFIRIQQDWEHDNFEKIWETSDLENSEKHLRTQQDWDLVDFEKIKGTSKLGNVARVSYLSLRQNYLYNDFYWQNILQELILKEIFFFSYIFNDYQF